MTVEIALEPGALPEPRMGVILCVYDGRLPEGLILAQWRSALVLRVRRDRDGGGKAHEEAGKDDVLIPGKPCFLTLSFGASGTTLFVNGEPGGHYPALAWEGARKGEHPRRLVMGNDSTGRSPWIGKIRGLSVRGVEVSPGDALKRFKRFEQEGFLPDGEPGHWACFPMKEGRGCWIGDAGSRCRSLQMPERFQILRKQVLCFPQEDWRLGNLHPGDMALNLIGFLFFGLAFAAWCLSFPSCRGRRLLLVVALAACGLSLLIELWQADLPGRHSSLTDWFLNTLGGALGALLVDPMLAAIRSSRRRTEARRESPDSGA